MDLDSIILQAVKEQMPPPVERPPDLVALESDPLLWARRMFPRHTTAAFHSEHVAYWSWLWTVEKNKPVQPYLICMFRGGAKSTSAEMGVAALGARSLRRFCIYVRATQDDADDSIRNIAALLESPSVAHYYPELGTPKLGKWGTRRGWSAQEVHCASGFSARGYGLDSAFRGARVEDARPDIIVLDDIDKFGDSPQVILKKLNTISRTILPTRGPNPVIIVAQNLIHASSVVSQIYTKTTSVLANVERRPVIRGFRNCTVEPREDEPWRYELRGEPNWPEGYPLEKGQEDLDLFGRESFLAEVQQDMTVTPEGSIYPEWNEIYHVITLSEFARYYGWRAMDPETGAIRIPLTWMLARAQDWGTTWQHPTATGWYARPSEDMDYTFDPLLDCAFKFREMVRPTPEFPETGPGGQPLINPVKIGKAILEIEKRWQETARMAATAFSHEQTTVLNVYLEEVPECYFDKNTSGKIGGIDVVKSYLEVNPKLPHPFRRYPANYPDPALAGCALMGRPRYYYIVADGEGELDYDEVNEVLTVRPAKTEAGLIRSRWEKPKYHWAKTLSLLEKKVPHDLDNDASDEERYAADTFFPPTAKLSKEQRTMQELKKRYPQLTLPGELPGSVQPPPQVQHDESGLWAAREIALLKLAKEDEAKYNPPANWRLRHRGRRRE